MHGTRSSRSPWPDVSRTTAPRHRRSLAPLAHRLGRPVRAPAAYDSPTNCCRRATTTSRALQARPGRSSEGEGDLASQGHMPSTNLSCEKAFPWLFCGAEGAGGHLRGPLRAKGWAGGVAAWRTTGERRRPWPPPQRQTGQPSSCARPRSRPPTPSDGARGDPPTSRAAHLPGAAGRAVPQGNGVTTAHITRAMEDGGVRVVAAEPEIAAPRRGRGTRPSGAAAQRLTRP